ncbi:hypothetical protein T492DRAFT_951376 [Pavlovales sp. CCMP2436]|nr:hypothetical protein T492DRAFT_951376 [Pavlovales sp. CCMP2436]
MAYAGRSSPASSPGDRGGTSSPAMAYVGRSSPASSPGGGRGGASSPTTEVGLLLSTYVGLNTQISVTEISNRELHDKSHRHERSPLSPHDRRARPATEAEVTGWYDGAAENTVLVAAQNHGRRSSSITRTAEIHRLGPRANHTMVTSQRHSHAGIIG